MVNRAELGVIRGARAGDPACQLALGKLYLFGGASLPRNMRTALHWLNRAARQQQAEAWMLIGSHVPFEHARHCVDEVLPWYERAFAAGIEQAGLVLAQLAPPSDAKTQEALRYKARFEAPPVESALQGLASLHGRECVAGSSEQATGSWQPVPEHCKQGAENREKSAESRGASAADREQGAAEREQGAASREPGAALREPSAENSEQAAQAGERAAQLALGLWFARLQRDGSRQPDGIATVNFKRAIRWLTLAGAQGDTDAWFALSRIYMKPEFSQRSVAEAQVCLERAAELGHRGAQLECGLYAWRHRRQEAGSDVRGVYWLQQAAAQGCEQAQRQLARIAPAPRAAAWGQALLALAPAALHTLAMRQPLLAARLTLARAFGLNRAEALLLDVKESDHGHCLVVDIRASYGRSKRRLIALRTAQDRQLLDQVVAQFDRFDGCLEGNYRQRLYRLKTCLPALADEPSTA